jgi:hypothetical protein
MLLCCRVILEHLSKSPRDYMGAVGAVPRPASLMWAHAYQSHVWNLAVTHRVNKGLCVLEGDLVGAPGNEETEGGEEESEVSAPPEGPAAMVSDAFTRVGSMVDSDIKVSEVKRSKYVHTYIHMHIHIHMHVPMHIYIHIHIKTYTYIHIHVHMHVPMHIHTHIHVHIYLFTTNIYTY